MILIDIAFLLRTYDRDDFEDSVLKYIKARCVRHHIILTYTKFYVFFILLNFLENFIYMKL